MNSRSEQVWVGLFVLVATALLIGTVLAVTGTFSRGNVPHRAYFKFAGGLEQGGAVRFGGMKAGSVQKVHVDPDDPTRIEVDFNVGQDIPLKTDSVAKISSLSPLGDNYVELTEGSRQAAAAAPGSEVKSAESMSFSDLGDMASELQPMVRQVLENLNQRLDQLQVTLNRTNDLLNDRNRANISASLGNVNAMLAEDRPKVSATLSNVQSASAQLNPLLDDLKKTMAQANDALGHVDAVVLENRQDLRSAVTELRQTLGTASSVVDQLDRTLDYNADNIDATLENIRVTTQHLRDLTEALKRRPYTLIRAVSPAERKPGEQ
ncbi:MAG TPA: MlaD family protein [Terriglobia bacterium]|jgi:phospholipid/cholesterol/gamma-HCH transport system substrate-binding protein|nr:MlaD family protein [Terriglobia bacterium]